MSTHKTGFLFDVDNTLLDNDRVNIVFPQQGHYALDPQVIATYPPTVVTVERICDLVNCELPDLAGAKRLSTRSRSCQIANQPSPNEAINQFRTSSFFEDQQ